MNSTRRNALLLLATVLAGAVAWALLAPLERSLGDRIRVVYLHASATWSGLIVLNLTGVAGLGAAFGVRESAAARWLPRTWLAGLAFFSAGFVLSLLAARQSWGAVYWAEPRVRASVAAIVLGILVYQGGRTLSTRLRHLFWFAAAALMTIVVRVATLVLHPEQPIQETTPFGIRATFYGLAALMLVGAAALAVALPAGGREGPGGEEGGAG